MQRTTKSANALSPRKLSLHKCTIRHLGEVELGQVAGGSVTTVGSEYASVLKPCPPERRTRIC